MTIAALAEAWNDGSLPAAKRFKRFLSGSFQTILCDKIATRAARKARSGSSQPTMTQKHRG